MNREKWFQELYRANIQLLYRVVSRLLYESVGHVDDAQDVIQDVFLLAARSNIYNHPKPGAWLVTTARNICKNYRRTDTRIKRKQQKAASKTLKKNARRQSGFMEPSADDMPAADLNLSLRQLLTAGEWELMEKYCLEGQTAEEIAAEQGVDTGTIYTRISRIRKKIKNNFYEV